MAEHEPCIGQSDDWYTPPEIFASLGLVFDLDPCSPGPGHWVPARKIYTKADDGLAQKWEGLVFMNPPFGGRNGHVPWLRRFIEHADGIAIVRAYTSAAWFHEWAVRVDTMLFPRGKTKFIRPDGTIGRAPGHGVVLLGMGRGPPGLCVRVDLDSSSDYRRAILAQTSRPTPAKYGYALSGASGR
jgi:hypothetical protein